MGHGTKRHSVYDQIMLFDLDNFKRKVRENPKKYDTRNNLIPLVEQARKNGSSEIRLEDVELYINDVWVLDAIGCFLEYEHLGACCKWYYYIFLDTKSHQGYLEAKKRHLAECFSLFVKSGLL